MLRKGLRGIAHVKTVVARNVKVCHFCVVLISLCIAHDSSYRNVSSHSGLAKYSKHTYSSKYFSKPRKRLGSEAGSIMTDMSTRKLTRVGSVASNKSGISRKSSKKHVSSTKHAKYPQRYVKNFKYGSPHKKGPRSDLLDSRMHRPHKKSAKTGSKGCKKKSATKPKKVSKPSNQADMHQKQKYMSDMAETDAYGNDTAKFVFNVNDDFNYALRKSATVQELDMGRADVGKRHSDKQVKSILKKSQHHVSAIIGYHLMFRYLMKI